MLLRLAVVAVIFVVVFGVLIPSFIDYRSVAAALLSLTWQHLVVVTALAILAYLLEGSAVAAPLPGLSLARGTGVYLSAAGVKNTIPAPVDLPLRYSLFRGWGFPAGASTLAVAVTGVMDQVSRLILPLPAVLLYTVEGTVEPTLVAFAAAGTTVFLVLVGVYAWMIRSRSFTERVGRLVERAVGALLGLFRRPAPAGIPARVVAFRDDTRDLMIDRGALSLGAAILAKLGWALLLLVALRSAGVPASALSAPQVVAVFAAVFLVLILPLAPGGAAVPELLFIGTFTTMTGGAFEAEITAGVFLYRVFQWFLVIPIGWLTLSLLRRGARGGLLGGGGERDAAAAAGGGA